MRSTLSSITLLAACNLELPPDGRPSDGDEPVAIVLEMEGGAARFGEVFAGGDLDGDGLADLVVGAPAEEAGGEGGVYVCRGDTSALFGECERTTGPAGMGDDLAFIDGPDGAYLLVGVDAEDDERDGLRAVAWGEQGLEVRFESLLSSGSSVSSLAPMGWVAGGFVVGSVTDYWGEGRGSALLNVVDESGFSDLVNIQANMVDGAMAGETGFGAFVDAPGDIDGDGSDDLVVGAASEDGLGSVHIVSGPFTSEGWGAMTSLAGSERLHGLSGGDVDSDGRAELAVEWDGTIAVYRSSAGGGLDTTPILEIPVEAGAADLGGDLDGDGHDDLAVVDEGVVTVYFGASGGFSGESTVLAEDGEVSLAGEIGWVGDLDGDGRDELAVSAVMPGRSSGSVVVFPGR